MREIVKTVGPMIAGMLALVGDTRDAHAVGNGEHDTAGAYPAVAKISLPGRTCTATLITPAWMVTAKHCIDGWKAEPGFDVDECDNNLAAFKTAYLPGAAQITVDFSLNAQTLCTPASPPNVPCTQHTLQISGTAIGHGPPGNADLCADSGTSQDIAIFQLDRRIPTSQIQPLSLPIGGVGPCEEGDMTIVGYGGDDASPPDGGTTGIRNFKTSSDWGLTAVFAGLPPSPTGNAIWTNFWVVGVETYNGVKFGDSGGPLLQNGKVCGINSTVNFELEFPDCGPLPGCSPPIPVFRSEHAATQAANAQAFFLANHVIDTYGEWMGACTKGDVSKRDIDSDNDLIPDACDPCPFVADPTYRKTGKYDAQFDADWDQDGVPDLCDNCPAKANAPEPGVPGNGQPDSDGDGLGDACDVCQGTPAPDVICCNTGNDCAYAGSSCFALAQNATPGGYPIAGQCAGFVGRCGRPRDFDNDTRPDNCDNCIAEYQNDQKDSDADGLGDACDKCPGVHPEIVATGQPVDTSADISTDTCPYGAVGADVVCVVKTNNSKSRCVYTGKCSLGRDSEPGGGDGIGDACDGCPLLDTKNDDNCNFHAEVYDHAPYPFKTDRCDPIPCARGLGSSPFPATVPAGLDHGFQRITEGPQIIPQAQAGATVNYSSFPSATVGHRYCECPVAAEGLADPVAKCHAAGCVVDGDAYTQPGSKWKVPHLQNATPTPQPGPQVPDGAFSAPLSNANALSGNSPGLLTSANPLSFDWDLTADGAQPVPCPNPQAGNCLPGYGVSASYWSAVRDVTGTNASNLPAIFKRGNHYQAQHFGAPQALIYQPQLNCPWCAILNCPTCNRHGIPDLTIRVNVDFARLQV